MYEGNYPAAARREALIQWLAVSGEAASTAEVLAALKTGEDLVPGSAYLLYARAYRTCAVLYRPAGPASATRPEDGPQKLAERIVTDLRAARAAAVEANDPSLAARAVLLHAEVLSRPPLRNARAALQMLSDANSFARAEPAIAQDAAWMRVGLTMDLGLVEEATRELASLPKEGRTGQAGVPLRLAEALAARYPAADEASRGRLREQVLALCNRAMTQALAEPNTYVGVARRCAGTLLSAGAGADAERILTELLNQPALQADAAAHLDARILLARALQEQGKTPQAAKAFEELTARFPSSASAFIYHGRFLLSVRDPFKAAESFRTARKLAVEGSAVWCEATLDLADALEAQGQTQGAADVLRVAAAIHPRFGNEGIRARLVRTQERLGASARPKE